MDDNKRWWVVDGFVDMDAANHLPLGPRAVIELEHKFIAVYISRINMYINNTHADITKFLDIYEKERLITGFFPFTQEEEMLMKDKESFIEHISGVFSTESIKKMAFYLDNDLYPFDELPIYINHDRALIRAIVKWRIHNGR